MCGIAGILGNNVAESELKKLLDPIVHRGERKYRYEVLSTPDIALGMHRLGIVDEALGKQPFQNVDQQVTLIFNGEIYNHHKLRNFLSVEYPFHSESDGEAILNAYLKWGIKFVNKLDGKFAIALYDSRKKQLILARDPMGVKPLYYAHKDGQFFFASEIKSFSQIDSQINELLPGHLLINEQQKPYFSLGKFNDKEASSAQSVQQFVTLKKVLGEAVKKRIQKEDSKIACLLSGGVDSSIITYLATQNHPNVIAYTLAEPHQNSEDLKSASKLTKALNIEHIIVSPSVEEMKKFYLKYGVYMTESFEPVLVRNAVAYHFVCKKIASDGFKYCLNGEGADELFGGYDFVKEAPKEKQDDLIRYSLSIIHNSYLKMADRASMFTTLEARVPYMDKELVKFALRLSPDARLSSEMNKTALRNSFYGELPDEIIYRKKVGMNEGAGFGVNRPNQSIYYHAVKDFYEKSPSLHAKDLELCSLNNPENNIDLSQIEEVYNFARFVEFGFNKLKDSTTRLQLNTSLKKSIYKMKN